MSQRERGEEGRVGLLTTIGSVLSAFYGVQSAQARARDFTHGSARLFFGVALALTAGFVLLLVGVVQLLLRASGVG